MRSTLVLLKIEPVISRVRPWNELIVTRVQAAWFSHSFFSSWF